MPSSVLARPFRGVEEVVGRAEERLDRLRDFETGHRPEADCHWPAVHLHEAADGRPQLPDHGFGGRGRRFVEQDREFVAAEPGDRVARTNGFPSRVRREPKHRIPRGVAVSVVHQFQVIDVKVGHRKRLPVARRAPNLLVCELVEGTPVLEPGELIGARELSLAPQRTSQREQGEREGQDEAHANGVTPVGGYDIAQPAPLERCWFNKQLACCNLR
jgi:hypothetical protein